MKTITVDFVRHGQTLFNILDKLQGWADSPLTPEGIATAKTVGRRLKTTHYDGYYASDLKRATDTASHIMAALPTTQTRPHTLPDFREAYFGTYEGLDFVQSWAEVGQTVGCSNQAEVIARYSFSGARDAMHNADPRHLSEDGATFENRVNHGLKTLLAHNDDHAHLMVVTHGTLIRSLALRFGQQFDSLSTFPLNGGVTTMQLQAADDEQGFSAHITNYNQA